MEGLFSVSRVPSIRAKNAHPLHEGNLVISFCDRLGMRYFVAFCSCGIVSIFFKHEYNDRVALRDWGG